MRQIQQTYSKGELFLAELPRPAVGRGDVLLRTGASAISVGTELQMVRLAQKSLVAKARARPDLVRRVLQKIKSEGLLATARQVKARLEDPVPMGYSCAGEVLSAGPDVVGVRAGDRVAAAGVGYATHAEVNSVPSMLVTPLPEGVSFAEGSFVAIGSIALHSLRRGDVRFGETVGVVGLGLLGLITLQLARAAGCRVVGSDPDPARRVLAESLGCPSASPEEFPDLVEARTDGRGLDATLITASTASSEVMIAAPEITRLRGRVVVVGFVGMDFPQKPYYERELDIVFSMSYGPGRYDSEYEEKGRDYPFSLVRWTEGRNMRSFLEAVSSGQVDLDSIITHRVQMTDALDTYSRLLDDTLGDHVGVVIDYPGRKDVSEAPAAGAPAILGKSDGDTRVGVIGVGSYATGTLLPVVSNLEGASIELLASSSGRSAAAAADRFGGRAVSEPEGIITSSDIDTVLILTRHDSHADLTVRALEAGKHVFVEKPLGLTLAELDAVEEAARAAPGLLMVGHNRRFSPSVLELKEVLGDPLPEPSQIAIRINAGPMEPDHWHRDPEVGGGRWIAEGSHFVDLASAFFGGAPTSIFAVSTTGAAAASHGESWQVTLDFPGGSTASILYTDLGDRALAKERVELFCGGACAVLDDFSGWEAFEAGRKDRSKHRQDKGHSEQLARFFRAVRGLGPVPVSLTETVDIMRATLLAHRSRALGSPLRVADGQPVNPDFADPERRDAE